ncbi:MAG: DNA recombination protein RmuC [candidate division Zixibacteria bacterium]|nr:DNA recombination protein RmuC [candidate division Zixibacteria bacterium]
MSPIIYSLGGLLIGAIIAWLIASQRTKSKSDQAIADSEKRAAIAEGKAGTLEATLQEFRAQSEARSQKAADDFEKLRERLSTEERERVKAETERREALTRLEEEKALLADARSKLSDAFKALASETLTTNSQQFLQLAKQALDTVVSEAKGDLGKREEAISGLVKPLTESLKTFDQHVRTLETTRQQAYTSLEEHLKTLSSAQQQLQRETGNLVTALRTPSVRGRWGEMTLRRVVELAGMSEHCDFAEQVSVTGEDGRYRPDLVVHLPSDRVVVVDSKVPLEAYLNALSAETDEQRQSLLLSHARQVRNHMVSLGNKSYWTQFAQTPEFVVMFIPGESFFAEAAHYDISLIEDGMQMKVVPATPTTLIALLRAVAYGWRQEQIAESAQAISELGKQLYERMRTLAEHLDKVGDGLEKANSAYSKAVSSLESRVLPAARRFKELGVGTGDDIPQLSPIDIVPRRVTMPELPLSDQSEN